ncbi:hypothetical protein J1N10_18350 [Carboxylicivirga sp. A043]|uniref:FKBP-type peptidyl-prolyl cis-trans isomerase n=1 Tax=Carboxylicivirga litoralis TaxID=2816963 RepID=UPI0021CAEC1D|nr:hypothetical protein [Carboxylicivirga sp. A043]MCU4157941.1 hypothetical protein [Carboxylicivirga sp. A043]
MNRRKTFNLTIISAIALLISFAACDDNNNYFNIKEAIAAEQELLERYYDEEMDNNLSRLDSTTAVAIDTVDHRFESGMMLYHTHIGEGDSIGAYKTVGFRYTNYAIGLTNDTIIIENDTIVNEVTREFARESNIYSNTPFTFTTYPVGGVPAASSNVYAGVNEAIMHMRLFGKAKVVMPSSLADNQYQPHVFEIEVTSVRR